ncbi:DNA polymerase III subunit beta [Sedimentibacter sp. zth1]|uniref:DNA polymerase III subunit beta n=1 Tax=Sedimentibacter sp. zth1 TaxID=2816908 RepID=UPI001A911DBF|nr:DNA polymerase III subunit beta [Sedimentibacter sp. zth1]QSX05181.1 DNA polymerase III subunit beta [Sedimentibacter sp. zth1]
MKISISQKDLNKAINIVQKAVTSRTSLPILSGILIEAYNNRLHLTATDLELGINTYVECDIIEEGEIVVHSKLLGDFVRKLPSNSTVNIKTTENNNLEIKCLNSDFSILGNAAKEFPKNTFENEGVNFQITSEVLKKLIKYTSFAVSQDTMKPIFTGCLLEVKNGICTFVGLDTFRMSVKSESINTTEEISTIIPSKVLNEITRILEEDDYEVNVVISESHISFIIENTTIMSSILEGKFVDYKSLLKNDFITTIKLNASEFKNSIERASLLAREDKNNLIILDIKENTMQINSTSEYGNAEEFIILQQKEGNDLKIGFNSKYISEVLKIIDADDVEMKFMGNINPCFITEADNTNFKYMVLPVRIS